MVLHAQVLKTCHCCNQRVCCRGRDDPPPVLRYDCCCTRCPGGCHYSLHVHAGVPLSWAKRTCLRCPNKSTSGGLCLWQEGPNHGVSVFLFLGKVELSCFSFFFCSPPMHWLLSANTVHCCCCFWQLQRCVGHKMAMELVLTGRVFRAKDAPPGLFNYVVPQSQVMPKVLHRSAVQFNNVSGQNTVHTAVSTTHPHVGDRYHIFILATRLYSSGNGASCGGVSDITDECDAEPAHGPPKWIQHISRGRCFLHVCLLTTLWPGYCRIQPRVLKDRGLVAPP